MICSLVDDISYYVQEIYCEMKYEMFVYNRYA